MRSLMANRDLRFVSALLLKAASSLIILSGVAYAVFYSTRGGPNETEVLGDALTQLAGTARTAGLLTLAAILLTWFAWQGTQVPARGASRSWWLLALGVVVSCAGLAGTAGEALSSTVQFGLDWYTWGGIVACLGTATLGIAIVLTTTWVDRDGKHSIAGSVRKALPVDGQD